MFWIRESKLAVHIPCGVDALTRYTGVINVEEEETVHDELTCDQVMHEDW